MPTAKATVQSTNRRARGEIIKQGFVTKLGGNKLGGSGNWKRRYMVLKDDLYYYEDQEAFETGQEPKGVVRLDISFCPMPNTEGNENHEFTIFAVPYEFTCYVETEEDMLDWCQKLRGLQELE